MGSDASQNGKNRFVSFPFIKFGSPQKIVVGAAHLESSSFQNDPDGIGFVIRVVSDTDCFIDVGTAPVASNTKYYLPKNTVEYISVFGSQQKISVIQSTAGGNIYICEGVKA